MKLLAIVLLCCGLDMGTSPWPQEPPDQYNHAYNGHLIIKRVAPAELHMRCRSFFAHACAIPGNGTCTVYLPAPTPGGAPGVYAALARHEIAHCNGWRHQ